MKLTSGLILREERWIEFYLKRTALVLSEIDLAERTSGGGYAVLVAPMHWIHTVGKRLLRLSAIRSRSDNRAGVGMSHVLEQGWTKIESLYVSPIFQDAPYMLRHANGHGIDVLNVVSEFW